MIYNSIVFSSLREHHGQPSLQSLLLILERLERIFEFMISAISGLLHHMIVLLGKLSLHRLFKIAFLIAQVRDQALGNIANSGLLEKLGDAAHYTHP